MNALNDLLGDDIQDESLLISTAEALRSFLRNHDEVIALKRAIDSGELTPVDIEKFVGELLGTFCRGKKFANETSLAAIAVAVESLPGEFAEKYLKDLAGLRIQELPMAPRVARLALSKRRENLALLTNRSNEFAPPVANQNIEFRVYVPAPMNIQNRDDRRASF